MANAHVSYQSVVSGEYLSLDAVYAPGFFLTGIVNGALMSPQIILPGEHGVARLARLRIDSLALVRPRIGNIAVDYSPVPPKLLLISETLQAARVGARVGASIGV